MKTIYCHTDDLFLPSGTSQTVVANLTIVNIKMFDVSSGRVAVLCFSSKQEKLSTFSSNLPAEPENAMCDICIITKH